ncbi:uncharacterized protein LOC126565931 [Anopheles maculipalpis]|uniref:uncharacterized protein LOC126565931 n=1 Tax=Anopheles maculipalpis TaxID=1496333 RepID=UPI002158E9E6|nr:uncharacterized protein LOC126565931 [Anopheles maculipalpis]
MIGMQVRDTAKPVTQCTNRERRPLGDIDVNRSHDKIIPSKDRQTTGEGHIPSAFQVFDDGETSSKKKNGIKISTKLASVLNNAEKKMASDKTPFLSINRMRSGEQLVTKDSCVSNTKIKAAIFNSDVPTNGVPVAEIDQLEAQFALMSVEKLHNKTQNQIPGNTAVTKNVSNATAHSTDIDLMKECCKDMCAILETAPQMQEPKSSTNSTYTGAIRKVVADTVDDKLHELPYFQLNVEAKEWKATPANATNETLNGSFPGSSKLRSGIRELPSFWNLNFDDHAQHGNTTGAQPCGGRKIVGRQLTSPKRRQKSVNRNIMFELDDRTQEILRYERGLESRRKKALEAMRVEQERIKWSALSGAAQKQQLCPIVSTNTKNQYQPAVIAATTNHNPTHTVAGIHGFQRTSSSNSSSAHSANQMPLLPLAEKQPAPVRSSICIMKHRTPPNTLIRYEKAELLKLNYSAKCADKRYDEPQDVFSYMTHFSID